jgi:Fe-S-cluster containining protein
LLPVFQGLTDLVVGVAEREAARQGQCVSCRKGCGACCRQLVPVSAVEARALARFVAELPAPRRLQVQERFGEAVRRLDAAGLLTRLRHPRQELGRQLRPLGLDYFRQGVACPFLEDESCSIHRDRPLACREYLVTSPAAECARPTPERVHCLPLPARASDALRSLDREASADEAAWTPLVLALEYAAAHPAEPGSRPAPALLGDFFAQLTGGPAPPCPGTPDPSGAD